MVSRNTSPSDWLESPPKNARWESAKDPLAVIPGLQTVSVRAGIKTAAYAQATGKRSALPPPDLGLVIAHKPVPTAAVFTRSSVVGAPVTISRRHLKKNRFIRAVLANSGNANTATGSKGLATATAGCRRVAKHLQCATGQVLVCSTGIIGRHLPLDRYQAGIDMALSDAAENSTAAPFPVTIMTTDTVPKTALLHLKPGKRTGYRIAGCCKGSGMIAPNMGTMHAYLATDLDVAPALLQTLLQTVVDRTFNRVSVDTDTSTSDSVILMATGTSGLPALRSRSDSRCKEFVQGLLAVCSRLAFQLADDGEGATHTLLVRVTGARSEAAAERMARTVGDSPLVKTAVAGGDPNWGRILAALGRSGTGVREKDVRIDFCGIRVFDRGQPETNARALATLAKRLKNNRLVTIAIQAGRGKGSAMFYGCDLTHGYISINADYTT